MTKSGTTPPPFAGFEPANTTPIPDLFFDQVMPSLSGSQLKVLLYIFRRTLGFKKTEDAISYEQFLEGITTHDGRVLDVGCGVHNRTQLSKALQFLERAGYITATRGKNPAGDAVTTLYTVRFAHGARPGSTTSVPGGSTTSVLPPPSASEAGSRPGSTTSVPGGSTTSVPPGRAKSVPPPKPALQAGPEGGSTKMVPTKESITSNTLLPPPLTCERGQDSDPTGPSLQSGPSVLIPPPLFSTQPASAQLSARTHAGGVSAGRLAPPRALAGDSSSEETEGTGPARPLRPSFEAPPPPDGPWNAQTLLALTEHLRGRPYSSAARAANQYWAARLFSDPDLWITDPLLPGQVSRPVNATEVTVAFSVYNEWSRKARSRATTLAEMMRGPEKKLLEMVDEFHAKMLDQLRAAQAGALAGASNALSQQTAARPDPGSREARYARLGHLYKAL